MPENKIINYVHHGNDVFVREDLKGRHREFCLCYRNCYHFGDCEIASALYALCLKYHVVTPVWECPGYEED